MPLLLLKEDKLQGLLIFHVDDFLSSGTSIFQEEIMIPLQEKYSFGKSSKKDFIYTGIHFFQNEEMDIFIDQEDFLKKI